MNKIIVDFSIDINQDNEIVNIKSFNNDFPLRQFNQMMSKPINSYLSLNPDEVNGTTEYNNIIFVYQIIEVNTIKKILFSKTTMEAFYFENALEHVEEGVHIYNKHGYAVYLNQVSEKMSGITSEDFVGKHLVDLYKLDEEFSTVLTTLRAESPTLNRCDFFTTKDDKNMITINSGYPVCEGNALYGAILTENSVETLKIQAHKKLYLNEYMANTDRKSKPSKYFHFKDIIHTSTSMADLINIAKKVSLNDSSILIYGETGTGKELLAQSIHSFGKTKDKPFVAVNCAAVPSNLAESLFFGTTKGAYTGSVNSEGFFSQANGGTLFLDEVNSMTLEMQSKLLRTLQDKTYRKIGSQKESDFNVRIIAASNEDLNHMLENKMMRSDFYYRVSTIVLNLPNLMERRDDIELLADHFINKFNQLQMKTVISVSKDVMELFKAYQWTGNIRELENVIEYAYALLTEKQNTIELEHLPAYLTRIRDTFSYIRTPKQVPYDLDGDDNGSLEDVMGSYEKWYLETQLTENDWNISKTAKKLNLKRQSLQYRMKKYNISVESAN